MSRRSSFHRYFKAGPVMLEWIPSWDEYDYPKFGAWFHDKHRGATLRFRGWLLLIEWLQ